MQHVCKTARILGYSISTFLLKLISCQLVLIDLSFTAVATFSVEFRLSGGLGVLLVYLFLRILK